MSAPSPVVPPPAAPGGLSAASPQPFPRQANSASAPPIPAVVCASSGGKLGPPDASAAWSNTSAAEGAKGSGQRGEEEEQQQQQQLRPRVQSAGASSATKGVEQRNGEPQAASTGLNPPSNLDIEALIALATSHSPPPGYVNPNAHRSTTPSFVYGPSSSPFPHSGTPTGGDTRVALFVGNLPFRVRWQDLKDLMRRAGTVLRADVALGPDNRSKGHGMVLMGSREDGMRAIDLFNGYNWQTRILEVRPERLPPEYEQHAAPMPTLHKQGSSPSINFPPQPHPQSGGMGPASNLLLGHPHLGSVGMNGNMRSGSPYNLGRPPFPHGGSSPSLQSASPAAMPSSSTLASGGTASASSPRTASPSLSTALLNHNHQQQVRSLTPKTTAAVPSPLGSQPADVKSLEQALASNLRLSSSPQPAPASSHRLPPPGSLGSLPPPPAFPTNGHAYPPMYAQQPRRDERPAQRQPDNLAGRVLFVGNLPFHIQWQDLKDLFRTAGNIQRANVALGGDGRSRGFGSVQYSTKEDAEIAIGLFNGYELNGRKLQVHHESADYTRQQPLGGQYNAQAPPPSAVAAAAAQVQQSHYQQRAQQQLGQLQMNFTQPTSFAHESSFYIPPSPYHGPPSPFHAPPSPYHPPQSPSAYGPPSAFPYFPPTFGGAQPFGSLPSTTEEPGQRRESASSASTSVPDPMPSPIGPPRGQPPGRIALPPAYPFNNGPPSAGSAMSPMHGRGLPMLTPSMPSFQFHSGFPQTPPLFPHFLSPGLGPMSPPLHSPPFFNPFLNAAPGAPMFLTQDNPMFPPSAVYQQAPPPPPPPPSQAAEAHEDAEAREDVGEPASVPVFASLSRDGSFSGGLVADGEGERLSEDGGERSKTPKPMAVADANGRVVEEGEGVEAAGERS